VEATAKDIMLTEFPVILPQQTIAEAITRFRALAGTESHRRVFGMMVTDETGRLIGMISMYDILLCIRPKHIDFWGDMTDIDITGLIDITCDRIKTVRVGDIMTTDVITIAPETHIFVILDIMIKKHVRRLPVLDGEKIVGIVYISDLFYYLHQWLIG
jgi:CBS domain-containing protein